MKKNISDFLKSLSGPQIFGVCLVAALLFQISILCPSILIFLFVSYALLIFFHAPVGVWLIFALLVCLEPTPARIGRGELFYAGICVWFCISVFLCRKNLLSAFSIVRTGRIFFLVAFLTVALNFFVARVYNVPIGDWIRGLIPFVFIVIALPVAVLIKAKDLNIRDVAWSIGASGVLFSLKVLYTFFYLKLWIPITLVDEETGKTIGPFFDRVTIHVQQATDVLLPAGIFIGVILFASSHRVVSRLLSMAMAVCCGFGVLVTYTRSMVLSCILAGVVVTIFILIYQRRILRSYVVGCLLVLVAGLIFVSSLGIERGWTGRMQSLLASTGQGRDVNITSRMEEFKIVLNSSLAQKIFGKGLGTKHKMFFPVSNTEVIEQDVAYVHSWPLYFVMVGGFFGIAAYIGIFFIPTFKVIGFEKNNVIFSIFFVALISLMCIYGLFFAVFRLISFNLILGCICGIYWGLNPLRARAK